ncbi:DUF3757 domain-containing protein [Xanthomonas axonopodis pv. phyllanthi]|uniref:DUF3757 domain-containing protein n=1 Tax=Xanthomonas axonopodis TaxID=53413 RepID=UPI003558E4E6
MPIPSTRHARLPSAQSSVGCAWFHNLICGDVLTMRYSLTPALMAGMLLSLSSAGALAKQPADTSAHCPAPDAVLYRAGRYHASTSVEVGSGHGGWFSTQQPNTGTPRHLSSALYYGEHSDTSNKQGVLVNCSYALSRGGEVDLAYFDAQTPDTQRNLVVQLKNPALWLLDQPPTSERQQFYTCTQSVKACAFAPLRLE